MAHIIDKYSNFLDACVQPQSTYAIETFVVGGQITDSRKLRQVILELDRATRVYRDVSLEIELTEAKLEKIKEKKYTSKHDIAIQKIKVQKKKNKIMDLRKTLKGVGMEIAIYDSLLEEYASRNGLSMTSDTSEVYKVLQQGEKEYYKRKMIQEALHHRLSVTSHIPVGVIHAVSHMGELPDFQKEIQTLLTAETTITEE